MRNSNPATGLSRRQFAALGVVTAAAAGYSGVAHAALPVQERKVQVETRDGTATVLYAHPAEGKHPGVVLWPDVAGLRSSNEAIARELASAGFAVMMIDPYYRAGSAPSKADKLANLREEHVTRDSKDLTAWLDAQVEVASAKDGYVVEAMGLSAGMLAASDSAQTAYLVAKPRGKTALSGRQMAALDSAIHATDKLAKRELTHGFNA
ncbi:dienelactone hydrolase family protein [Novosphingobium sp. B 225]|uniref:dienelactone hydrolase family protein n=1 Tax=Novosphingobium sp. B 225 TaxID=1961849 RepID=UPI000B4BD41F|nr:dienelactone hydrolase family protein [Novosphingobium sp. B 225]